MTQDDAGPARRTRRRATSPQGAPRTPSVTPPTDAAPEPAPAPVRKPRHKTKATAATAAAPPITAAPTRSAAPRRPQQPRPKGTDRGLQELVGGGPSQLDPARALRARDVNRPTAADLAAAERSLQIVHRNWKPQ